MLNGITLFSPSYPNSKWDNVRNNMASGSSTSVPRPTSSTATPTQPPPPPTPTLTNSCLCTDVLPWTTTVRHVLQLKTSNVERFPPPQTRPFIRAAKRRRTVRTPVFESIPGGSPPVSLSLFSLAFRWSSLDGEMVDGERCSGGYR